MRRRARIAFIAVLAAIALLVFPVALLLVVPAAALAASGNDVGQNLGSTLRHYAGEIYGGIIAIVGLLFLFNRRFTDLAMFLLAAIVVGWLVFSPDQVANTARAIGDRILP